MIKNSKLKSKGFGLLEVVICLGIISMVATAALVVGRLGVRMILVANQRAQAYNLARADLEGFRVLRDSTWIDNINNNWNDSFSSAIDNGEYNLSFNKSSNSWLLQKGSENVNLDGVKFNKKIVILSTSNSFNQLLQNSAEIINTNGNSLVIVQSIVSWDSYGKKYSVISSFNLSDWKMKI